MKDTTSTEPRRFMEIFVSVLAGFLINLVKIAAILAVSSLIIFAPPLLGAFYTLLAFYPIQQELTAIPAGKYKCDSAVRFSGPQGNLCGLYYKNAATNKIILVSHGNAGNIYHRLKLAEHLLNTGCSVFLYDYAGYGASEGKPSPSGVQEDGLAAYDYVEKTLGYGPDQIILYGESLGCAVSSYVSTKRPVAALIVQSGFLSLPQIAKEKCIVFKPYPDWAFYKPHLSNADNLQTKHPPLLIMHGVKDAVIPFRHAEQLASIAGQPVVFVPLKNSGHNDTYISDSDLFDTTLKNFLESLP